MDNIDHSNIKVFKQHGFIVQKSSGDSHVLGRCPFCVANRKFYINVDTKKWDCKSCGRSGGYQMFLKSILEMSQKAFTTTKAKELAERRGCTRHSLKDHGIGFNPTNETFLIPVWDVNGEELYNLRIYKKNSSGRYKDLYNSSGCKAALYGWDNTKNPYKEVWLVEGEWDKIVMQEILKKEDKIQEGHIALGLPGADIFKPDWLQFFKDKITHVILDYDLTKVKEDGTVVIGAGFRGAHKVHAYLDGVARKVDYIHWPKGYTDGFDLSDYYLIKKRQNSYRALKGLSALMKPLPADPPLPEGVSSVNLPWKNKEEEEFTYSGKGISHLEVYDGYRKWLHLPDTTILDLMFGSIIANRLPGHPLWILIVGPSGSGKSELIMSLNGFKQVYPISSLTTKTLISGSIGPGGSDPSLAARLDGKILAIKDLTETLSMNVKDRELIFGQLRNLYDGEAQKPFGTGVEKVYNVKFGLVAGVTGVIELFTEGHTALGERYISAPMPVDRSLKAERKIMNRAYENMHSKDKDNMKIELSLIAEKCLDCDFGDKPELSRDMMIRIQYLAQWLSRMRASVERDSYTKDITHFPFIEMPTRIFEQFSKWIYGVTMFHHKKIVGIEEYNLIKNVAAASAPRRQEMIVRKMFIRMKRTDNSYSEADFVKMTGLPAITCKYLADGMVATGVLSRTNGIRKSAGFGHSFRLSDECIELMRTAELYT